MPKATGWQKKPLRLQIFVKSTGTLGYYQYSIAKPGGTMVNQKMLM